MLRKNIFFFVFFIISANATAATSNKVEISTTNILKRQQSNTTEIRNLETEITDLATFTDKHIKCAESGLVLLTGAANTDGDGCYNLDNSTIPGTTIRPEFAGFLSNKMCPNTTACGANTFLGRFKADELCHASFADSRALVFEDLKYVLPTLNLPANVSSTPVWVFDAVKAPTSFSLSTYLSKDEQVVTDLTDCNGWVINAGEESNRGVVLKNITVGSDTFFEVADQTCNTSAYIACVYN